MDFPEVLILLPMLQKRNKLLYQENYTIIDPRMTDPYDRRKKARKIIAILGDFLKNSNLDPSLFSVLELGCAQGRMTHFFAKYFKKIVAVDIDEKAIEMARSSNKDKNVSFQLSDALKLPFKGESFDLVIFNHVYEHVPSAKKVIIEIHRVLKKGGICYFSGPNKWTLIEPHYFLPFLSWFPKGLANYYLRLFHKGSTYYETSLSHSELKKLVFQFDLTDYTLEVVKRPNRFSTSYPFQNIVSLIPKFILRIFVYNMPSFFWILRKKA